MRVHRVTFASSGTTWVERFIWKPAKSSRAGAFGTLLTARMSFIGILHTQETNGLVLHTRGRLLGHRAGAEHPVSLLEMQHDHWSDASVSWVHDLTQIFHGGPLDTLRAMWHDCAVNCLDSCDSECSISECIRCKVHTDAHELLVPEAGTKDT
jgi:hypothetical protein